MKLPSRIVCLTEESVEVLFLIGEGYRIVGVSNYVVRPKEALSLPKVSMFTSSSYEKIEALNPDLILGFSDIQSDIARDLIKRGHNVFISNHRSLEETLNYIFLLSSMVGASDKGQELVGSLRKKLADSKNIINRPIKVYFEEWDDPMISAIKWVSDLITHVGGIDIFRDKSNGSLAKDRFVTCEDVINANPDIIFGCWCGKKVKIDQIKSRSGWENINAVKNNNIFELDPAIFLQPGPAPIISGIDLLLGYLV
jgi:iron complex transport system substrate-binding protein